MDEYTVGELAFRNGYKKAIEEIFAKLDDSLVTIYRYDGDVVLGIHQDKYNTLKEEFMGELVKDNVVKSNPKTTNEELGILGE